MSQGPKVSLRMTLLTFLSFILAGCGKPQENASEPSEDSATRETASSTVPTQSSESVVTLSMYRLGKPPTGKFAYAKSWPEVQGHRSQGYVNQGVIFRYYSSPQPGCSKAFFEIREMETPGDAGEALLASNPKGITREAVGYLCEAPLGNMTPVQVLRSTDAPVRTLVLANTVHSADLVRSRKWRNAGILGYQP